MNAPEVTIGVSYRDAALYFRLALQSVFAQSFEDWELILINDGSRDGSAHLTETLHDRRVRVFDDGEGRGLHVRLNQMVQAARGRYFFRMDADDIMHPDRLRKQVELLRTCDPRNTVVGSHVYTIDLASRVVGGGRPSGPQKTGYQARRSFYHPTVAASTEWFRSHPYNTQNVYFRSQDAELWCRTAKDSTFIVLPDRLLFYREGASQISAYIQTQMGLIHLLQERFSHPRLPYLLQITEELAKVWIAAALQGSSLEPLLNWVRCNKISVISESERAAAEHVLQELRESSLPLLTESATAARNF